MSEVVKTISEKTATASEQSLSLKENTVELIKSPNVKPKTIRRLNVGTDNQEKVQYAYSLGGKEFVYLLSSENGEWTYQRKHPTPHYRNGKAYYDRGLCGVSEYYHPEITGDKRFLTDWKWQMGECYKLWKGGTTFYGEKHFKQSASFRASITSQFIFE